MYNSHVQRALFIPFTNSSAIDQEWGAVSDWTYILTSVCTKHGYISDLNQKSDLSQNSTSPQYIKSLLYLSEIYD